MRESPTVPQDISARVGAALSNAEQQAARLIADAERRAAQVRPPQADDLRDELANRIKRLEAIRAQVAERRRQIPAHFQDAAAVLEEIAERLRPASASPTPRPDFENVLTPAPEGSAGETPPRFAGVVSAAQAAAKEIIEEARGRARQASELARRDADQIAADRRFTRTPEHAAREAGSLRNPIEEATRSLAQVLASALPSEEHERRSSG